MHMPIKLLTIFLALFVSISCQHTPNINHENMGGDQVLAVQAETRFLISNEVIEEKNGVTRRKRIFCAEPSPDIMKAVQESFSLGLTGEAPMKGVDVKAAIAISKARAESAAQLGQRLATIQLLRDSLYRACEAFANGAFDKTTYAVMLSRYDDVMVTLLVSELVAGNFGRSLATLAGSAETDGKAEETPKETPGAEGAVQPGVKTEAEAKALATAAGSISAARDVKIAEELAKIQRKYLENINSDALVVACITSIGGQGNPNDAWVDFCLGSESNDRQGGFLDQIIEIQGRVLMAKIKRDDLHRDVEAIKGALKRVKEVEDALKQPKLTTISKNQSDTLKALEAQKRELKKLDGLSEQLTELQDKIKSPMTLDEIKQALADLKTQINQPISLQEVNTIISEIETIKNNLLENAEKPTEDLTQP